MGFVGCGGRLGGFSLAGPALKPFDAGSARAFARGITCSSKLSHARRREYARQPTPVEFDSTERQ